MDIKFTINDTHYIESINNKNNVINLIKYNASNPTNGKSFDGELALSTVDLSNFIEFEQLTEEDLISWIIKALKDSGIYDDLLIDLSDQIKKELSENQPIIKTGLPWVNAEMDPE